MGEVRIYGASFSTYVRTTYLAAEEKGIAYSQAQDKLTSFDDMGSPQHLALHPFAKVPIMDHDGFRLFETMAIGRYIDEAFEGPALQPSDITARALCEQWLSAIGQYVYPAVIGGVVLPYFMAQMSGTEPDKAAVTAAAPKAQRMIEVLEAAYGDRDVLVGDSLTLADLLLAPILFYYSGTPEGEAALSKAPGVKRGIERMSARDSYRKVVVPVG